MWKDIERISGVPFSRSASTASRDNSSLGAVEVETSIDSRRLDSLRIALDNENKTNASIQIELNNTKVALLDARSRANDTEQTNTLLQDTIDKLRVENDSQRNDLLQLSASAANKGTQLEHLHDHVKDLKKQLSELSSVNDTLRRKHSQTFHNLELSKQRMIGQEMELKRLELCLSDATKQYTTVKEAAQVELKQRTMILQTKLDVLKDSEAREQQAQKAKREAADEIPKLMTKFKLERDTLRAEMTKIHDVEIERYKSHLEKASTQLKEMDSRVAKQAEEYSIQLDDVEGELKETSQAMQGVRAEMEEKRSQCNRLQEEIEKLKDDVTCSKDKLEELQKEKADESQASQVLIDRLQGQVSETKESLEKERSANAATLSNLENTIIAMVRDNFSSRIQVPDAQKQSS